MIARCRLALLALILAGAAVAAPPALIPAQLSLKNPNARIGQSGTLTPDEQKRLAAKINSMTPKQRKQLARAMKKMTPAQQQQFASSVKRQLRAQPKR
jgi:hypothetical protein